MRVLRFVFALILISMSTSNMVAANVHHHLNYGVTFTKHGLVAFSGEDFWTHSFLIDIGKPFEIPAFPFCEITAETTKSSICAAKNRLAFNINAIREELGHNLNDTVKLLDQLLPNTELPTDSKPKRAILGFLGTIIHDLTGLSDEEEINQIQGQINTLKRAISAVGNSLMQQGSDLSSFMKTINDRLTNAVNGVHENALQTERLVFEFHNTSQNLERLVFLIGANIIKEFANVQTINHQYNIFKQALSDLAEGKLSPLLIKPTLLRNTIADIQNILSRDYPNFFLISTNPQYYYRHADFSVYRQKSNVLITIKFPISSMQTFELYKVYTWPSPINASTNSATQIKDLPDYLAISIDREFFVPMTNYDASKCIGTDLLICKYRPTLRSVNSKNCVANLFLAKSSSIKQQCNFRFLTNAIKPHLHNIGQGQLIVYRTSSIIIECPPNKRKVITGCDFCVIKLQCGCLAISEDILFQSSVTQCSNSKDTVTKLYPVNLALLHSFFNDKELADILANTTFNNPLKVILPNFNIYKHHMSHILSDDHNFDLSLKHISRKVRNNSKIYRTLTDAYLDGQFSLINDTTFDYKLLINIIALALSVLNAIVVFFLFRKLKLISSILLASHTVRAISTELHYKPENALMNAGSQNDHDFLVNNLQWNHVIFLVCMLVLISQVICLLYKLYHSNDTCTILALEISNARSCVSLEVFKLASCPYFYEINSPSLISQLAIIGFYRPQLNLKFENFKITDFATGKIIEVPEKINLSWSEAYKLQSILKLPFLAHVVVRHQNCAYVLNTRVNAIPTAPPTYLT